MTDEQPRGGEHDNPRTDHEVKDVNIRAVVRVGLGLVALVVVACVGMLWLWRALEAREEAKDTPPVGPAAKERIILPRDLNKMPRPHLEAWEERGHAELRAEEERKLTTYGWADRDAGAVHVPIDRAIELVLKDGLPARPAKKSAKGSGK